MNYLQNDEFVYWGLSVIIGTVLVLWILRLVSKKSKTKEEIQMTNEKGFTLIELFIVIAIIGILAAIAIPQFASYRARGFDADTKQVLRTAALEQEAYFMDHTSYTTSQPSVSINSKISFVITVGPDSYHMEAKHESSPQWFVYDGPGGSPRTL